MAMALVDRALQAKDLGEAIDGPAQNEEFVLFHSDNIEAQGFVQHLKLPHYIDFQAELNLIRKLRCQYDQAQTEPPGDEQPSSNLPDSQAPGSGQPPSLKNGDSAQASNIHPSSPGSRSPSAVRS